LVPSSRSSSQSRRRTTDLLLVDPPDAVALVERLRIAGCVFAEDEADVLLTSARTPVELEHMVQQRIAGAPLEHIVGWADFAGLHIAVDPGVFVPRRRTELLLGHAQRLAPSRPVVLELCCGSAALSVALGSTLPDIELYASDIDPVAVRCAHRNLASLASPAYVLQGDLYEPLPPSLAGRVDLLLANAPYVPTEEISLMPREARRYESRVALDGGSDGLDVQRRIAAHAQRWLAPDGHVMVETSRSQAAESAAILARIGFATEVVTSDELDATAVIGWFPERGAAYLSTSEVGEH
jgi:release factor glutamine methyltransferase